MNPREQLNRTIGKNMLCELTLLDSERHEILKGYERRQAERKPYPTLAVQMFCHNVRHNATVAVYRAHVPDLLEFAQTAQIEWLKEQIVAKYRADRDARQAMSTG